MRVLPIDPTELGAVVLRQVPEERPPTADGERVFVGRVIVPGRFGPQECRLRTSRPFDGAPGVVTLHGTVRATSWFLAGGRGVDAKSEVTITAEEIRPSTDAPVLAGRDLPVRLPFEQTMLLSTTPTNTGEQRCALMVPADVFDGDGGVAEVMVTSVDTAIAPGSTVRIVGLSGRVSIPDRGDAGRYSKAKVLLSAQRLELAEPVTAGRSRRESAPVPSGEGEAA